MKKFSTQLKPLFPDILSSFSIPKAKFWKAEARKRLKATSPMRLSPELTRERKYQYENKW